MPSSAGARKYYVGIFHRHSRHQYKQSCASTLSGTNGKEILWRHDDEWVSRQRSYTLSIHDEYVRLVCWSRVWQKQTVITLAVAEMSQKFPLETSKRRLTLNRRQSNNFLESQVNHWFIEQFCLLIWFPKPSFTMLHSAYDVFTYPFYI